MIINNICSPAIIYLGFSLTQIIIDIYKTMYNTAFLKFVVSIVFTIILNILCERGIGIISWIIVFIPFIFMTLITTILLYIFGLDPFFGKLKYNVTNYNGNNNTNNKNEIIVYDKKNRNIYNTNKSRIINNENSHINELPINRILENNKKNNKQIKNNNISNYSELNENENESNKNLNNNRNSKSNNNQNTNNYSLLNNKSNDSKECFKSCLESCNKKNKNNDTNFCPYSCTNICNKLKYKTI
tara:strand:+ start:280 stop:1008 length:729 start_codon:yes stop_codon:yes gene_type:complete